MLGNIGGRRVLQAARYDQERPSRNFGAVELVGVRQERRDAGRSFDRTNAHLGVQRLREVTLQRLGK